METFLIRALQLIMSLSLLVIVHEGGHFLFSRLFKVRVEKFCIFFDPWFTLFKFKPKKSETEYAIGWLPLGGYVKIAGMIDESMDTEQMKEPAKPWEFRSKPAWQRLLIMVGGVVFNFILALFIYSMILFHWGDEYIDVSKATAGMVFNESAKNIGFRDGDVLLSADGKPFDRLDIQAVVDARQVTVLRGGKEASVYIPDDFMQDLMKDSVSFAYYIVPYSIDGVKDNTPAQLAGLQVGDTVVAMNGKPVSFYEYQVEMLKRKEKAKKDKSIAAEMRNITLTYSRAGVLNTVSLQADDKFNIGVETRSPGTLPIVRTEYGFFESFPAGIELGVNTLKGYVTSMRHIFSKEGAKQLGGFGTIGSIFPPTWDWYLFWRMTAFLSIILAFMNILPIPALDGGHVLFLLYEMIARRKPSDKFMEYAQVTGMILLFGLLIWANFNDIMRFFF